MQDILRILEQDARATPERIAAMTGRTVEEVRALVEKAEKDRVILSYKTQIDWDKAGEGPVYALIEVKIVPQRDVGFDSTAMRIARFPEVRSMHLVSGDYDLLIQVVGKTIYEISSFVSNKLSVMEAVQATNTHFILKRYKEDGTLIIGEDGGEGRLPLSL
jgi:DNA-binding Lrp family transcriptional regulator